ncbi:hypothetical protein [Helicobacter sp. MIT 14-3879]|uniref:hypothetical protein n=1 Tax=Helicobacter sp. MIT 14-3879 TaxID=2040649 RepID=UPI000E1EB286|nr:hypothetical protein [Helicobacter sp. MIT 14-3879]RDU60090.1 hypothetical protein CQA44_10860 [Helicobacter sp. MIT 14-3879]
MRNITAKYLRLSSLKQKGLCAFCIIDIRTTQSFLSAHLQDSIHANNQQEIIDFLKENLTGGGAARLFKKYNLFRQETLCKQCNPLKQQILSKK